MSKISPAMWQSNGLVLLNGYLQRLYVQDEILQILGDRRHRRCCAELSARLASADGQMKNLRAGTTLLLDLLDLAGAWWEETLPRPRSKTHLAERLAAVGGAIHGERAINEGLIHLGRQYDPALAEEFLAQRPYHEQRVEIVTNVVGLLAGGADPAASERQLMEGLYDDLVRNRQGIQSDLAAIRKMLRGYCPANLH